MKVLVKKPQLRGLKVSSRWGTFAFDGEGCASGDVPEEDLPLLAALGWSLVDSEASTGPLVGTPEEAIAAAHAAGVSAPGDSREPVEAKPSPPPKSKFKR